MGRKEGIPFRGRTPLFSRRVSDFAVPRWNDDNVRVCHRAKRLPPPSSAVMLPHTPFLLDVRERGWGASVEYRYRLTRFVDVDAQRGK
ncbi:hypothetical protein TNCV_3660841 [Trichonephila clavipes]|nr:hypothetical protein TNCV_3660841 [Trichonephila clavipes]